MGEPEHDSSGNGTLDRRTVVAAAAAALGGAAVAKLTDADEALGGHSTDIAYDSQTVVHMDVTNTGAGSTRVSSNIAGTAAFVGLNNYPVGISRPDGILGRTAYTTSNAAGVAGTSEAANGGIGVLGAAKSTTGVGVFGFSGSVVPSETPPPGTGVFGRGPQRGVIGNPTTAGGTGVEGRTQSGTGVLGEADGGVGVQGNAGGGTGVRGRTATGVGVHGTATGSGLAARFDGRSVIDGHLQVDGTVQIEDGLETVGKPAVALVKGSDGSTQRTYPFSGLSPAFEHVGEAKLRRGRATIKLPADFDTLVPGKAYQVFLTEYGDFGGLYVPSRAEHSFTVRARRGTANGRFAYRVVATRADLRS